MYTLWMDRETERERKKMLLESKRDMEAENGGATMMTATEKVKEKEEIMSLTKRRRIHDSDEIGDLKENLLLSMENSAATTTSSSLVMNGELLTDLKGGEDFETVASTFGEFSIETSLSGENSGTESVEVMESSSSKTKRKSPPRKFCVPAMPSTTEIEDFFSAAEKSQQERFTKKYNYDIVKDIPMKGRYQWIPLKL